MQIPILYGPNCLRDSIWCEQIRIGMEQLAAQRRYTLYKIDGDNYRTVDYDALFEKSPRLMILISAERAWTAQALSFLEMQSVQVILIDDFTTESTAIQGQVLFHYENAIRTLLGHLRDCGCSRPALFGYLGSSAADALKKRYFVQELQGQGVRDPEAFCFENRKNLDDCYDAFLNQIDRFDSAICVNDIAAVLLVRHLMRDRIRIPEDLQVVTVGSSTKLRQIQSATISGIDFSDRELGKNAILLFRYLWHDFCDNGSSHIYGKIYVSGKLSQGNTTAVAELPTEEETDPAAIFDRVSGPHNFYEDRSVHSYSTVERLIHACDEKDLQILHDLLEDISYEKISGGLFLSKSSIHYRIRRMEKIVGVQSLDELKLFLRSGRFEEFLKP